jgi:hypothetical protein
MARFRQPDEEPSYLVQPKHAKFATKASHASAAAPAAQQPAATSSDAPRPIGVDPAETGAFSKITADQGAVVTNRDSAAEAVRAARKTKDRSSKRMKQAKRPEVKTHGASRRAPRKLLAVLGIALALVVIGVAVFAILHMGDEEADVTPSRQVTQEVSASEGVFYDGYTYSFAEKDGGAWWFERTAEGSTEPLDLFALEGVPVNLVMYNGIFVIPENVGENYDVIAYTLGDGSVPMQVTSDGASGTGSIESAALDGSKLVLTMQGGGTVDVELG